MEMVILVFNVLTNIMYGTGAKIHVFLMFVNWKTVLSVKLIPKSVKCVTLEPSPTSPLVDVLKLTLIIVLELVFPQMELNAGIVIQVFKSII